MITGKTFYIDGSAEKIQYIDGRVDQENVLQLILAAVLVTTIIYSY